MKATRIALAATAILFSGRVFGADGQDEGGSHDGGKSGGGDD